MLRKLRLLVHQLVESGFFFQSLSLSPVQLQQPVLPEQHCACCPSVLCFAVELDNFFRIFVRRSHLFDQAFHALFVSFQLVGADNFAQQQANNYAAFSLFFEQFARQFQSLFFVATERCAVFGDAEGRFAVDRSR